MFMEHENSYAYNIMENKGYAMKLNNKQDQVHVSNYSLEELLSENWSKKPPHTIFETFSILGVLCSEHNKCISDKVFDDFIDNLTDNLTKASDAELKLIFYSLLKWPVAESIKTRNFIEVWAALDDECLKRLRDWSYDEMLEFITLFYMLNVNRASDYSYRCLLKLASKAKHLTASQLVRTMFFIGIQRKSPKDIHQLEIYINECFKEFSIDELAIISMGFFKSKTPIRNMDIIVKIIDIISNNSSQIHEISLAALLKIIRYSMKVTTGNKIYLLLDKLQAEVPRLSVMCNVHVGLLGTSTLTLHEGCLNAISNRVADAISETRIKDLERLTLTFGTFNYTPQSKNFLQNIIAELKKPEREVERTFYGRSFVCCVAYLGLLGIHPEELIKLVFDPLFLQKTYGKHIITYGREILTLHNRVKIFYKDSNIKLLSDKEAIILAKKYTDYVPNENYKKQYNVSERMFLDVLNILKGARGDDFVTGGHILTHHQRGDIILCNDHKGCAVPVGDAFDNKHFGLLRTPPNNNTWIVLIIGGRNALIHNTKIPSGLFKSKINELNALGYCAELVLWEEFSNRKTKEEKLEYLKVLIDNITDM
ncbi:FAST kinase domain-containing protein 5, mitochondrial [Papilio machaon]|uniref:FAST kinase domain-containing protein 5, mitochondrial n=1 Tax=Papilio machaon TaxID=76193 RepID=UPI001E6659B7|nr:FAST kinase domain-containing protein 5, mitochondrial [Papilio machaon]